MLNRIILIGRLVADPQLRYTSGGVAVANFRIAVDRPYANQQGKRETDFIDIVVWRKLAEIVANNLTKGRLIAVDGRLQIRTYEKDGVKRQQAEVYADDVRFLDSRREDGGSAATGSHATGSHGMSSLEPPMPPDDFGDNNGPDDVPF